MSTLLTPVLTQIEIDRDRFKILVNGTETDTVQLENREELSIAGQVADRIDSQTINLTSAVNDAESARDSAIVANSNAQSAKDTAVSAKTDAVNAKDASITAQGDAEAARDEASDYRDETEILRNETIDATQGGITYIPRYETDSLAVDPMDGVIDIAMAAVWRVDGTTTIDLVFPDPEDFTFEADRAQSVVVFIEGSGGAITWPLEVEWAGDSEPALGTSWTNVVLFWTGTMWIGMESAKK